MIPENWEEELMLHSWKMMRIERCSKDPYNTILGYWHFPNGIEIERFRKISVNMEFGNLVESILEDWEIKKKLDKKKGNIIFELSLKDFANRMTHGEYFDMLWSLYSLAP
ncbi:MAG: hypothetical protein ACTSUO_09840 [Candidatus Thorarchaeota archaeon]